MSLSTIINKISYNYKEGGISQVIKRGIKKIGYQIFHTNSAWWYRNNLSSFKIPAQIFTDKSLSIDFINTSETIKFIRNFGYFYEDEIIVGAKEGHYFTSLKLNDRIIGYNKTGFNRVYIEDFKDIFNFPANVAFTYDTFILPEYRNKGYASFLLANVLLRLKENGFKSIWAHIPAWNVSSERVHTKLGFKKICFVRYFHLLFFDYLSTNIFKKIEFIEKNGYIT